MDKVLDEIQHGMSDLHKEVKRIENIAVSSHAEIEQTNIVVNLAIALVKALGDGLGTIMQLTASQTQKMQVQDNLSNIRNLIMDVKFQLVRSPTYLKNQLAEAWEDEKHVHTSLQQTTSDAATINFHLSMSAPILPPDLSATPAPKQIADTPVCQTTSIHVPEQPLPATPTFAIKAKPSKAKPLKASRKVSSNPLSPSPAKKACRSLPAPAAHQELSNLSIDDDDSEMADVSAVTSSISKEETVCPFSQPTESTLMAANTNLISPVPLKSSPHVKSSTCATCSGQGCFWGVLDSLRDLCCKVITVSCHPVSRSCNKIFLSLFTLACLFLLSMVVSTSAMAFNPVGSITTLSAFHQEKQERLLSANYSQIDRTLNNIC